MIEEGVPKGWQDLQGQAARILQECGVAAEVEKEVETARGRVSVDVWAHDGRATPPQTYLLECKHWKRSVTKAVVHAFRTVVGDSGANWGAIVTTSAFQSGTHAAARYSNVRLLSWQAFQSLFLERWYSRHFTTELLKDTDALLEYTEPINSRIFRKADSLSKPAQEEFRVLRDRHTALAMVCLFYRAEALGVPLLVDKNRQPGIRSLPLRKSAMESLAGELDVSEDILDARSYRSLLSSLLKEAAIATAEFDGVFGERA